VCTSLESQIQDMLAYLLHIVQPWVWTAYWYLLELLAKFETIFCHIGSIQ
jgi:hypothetical protein